MAGVIPKDTVVDMFPEVMGTLVIEVAFMDTERLAHTSIHHHTRMRMEHTIAEVRTLNSEHTVGLFTAVTRSITAHMDTDCNIEQPGIFSILR